MRQEGGSRSKILAVKWIINDLPGRSKRTHGRIVVKDKSNPGWWNIQTINYAAPSRNEILLIPDSKGRASPTGSTSPGYKIIWTFSSSSSSSSTLFSKDPAFLPVWLCAYLFVRVCPNAKCVPLPLTKQCSQFWDSGFRDDNFPEFNLLSENLLV